MVASAPHWQRLLVLVPVFVIGAGLILGCLILLGRAGAQTIRESKHPRWFYFGAVGLVGVVAVLTYLGVKLPRE